MTFCLESVQTECHCIFYAFWNVGWQKNRVAYAVFGIKLHSIGKRKKKSVNNK